jgi:hypothetical protein
MGISSRSFLRFASRQHFVRGEVDRGHDQGAEAFRPAEGDIQDAVPETWRALWSGRDDAVGFQTLHELPDPGVLAGEPRRGLDLLRNLRRLISGCLLGGSTSAVSMWT